MAVKCPECRSDNPKTATFCADCGAQIRPPKDISATKTIETPVEEVTRGTTFADRYEIIEKLGKGGMGTVYRVEDKKIGQDIALKLIRPEISSDKKTIERFRNELKTTRMISHRNVCRMFDLGDAEGKYFITMEYIPGEDLKSLIRRVKQIPEATAKSIAKQVCEGLKEAHRLGVVHRDLKPSNIMIDKEGNARIMDFGIARSLEAKGLTATGVMIGTPEYMSPEQVEGKEVDQRSDIYSLGVILYEMVTGKVPFEGDTPFTIGMKHKGEIPKNPKELNTQISDSLNRVILKCLEKEKEERYQSAGEVHSELTVIEKDIPTTDRVIPLKKPATSKKVDISFSLKKYIIPAFVVIAVVTVMGIILRPILQKESTSSASERISISSEKSAPLKVKVIVDNAIIKATPEIGGITVARVPLNTVLKIEEKLGEWYKIYIEIEGVRISGFIHEILVEEESESIKVCAIVDNAEIKTTPDIAGETIATVPLNAVLEVKSKQKEWYEVYWEKAGIKSTGFIHEMAVEVVH